MAAVTMTLDRLYEELEKSEEIGDLAKAILIMQKIADIEKQEQNSQNQF